MNPRSTWRLIDTGPCDGATNMAIDEALLNLFEPGRSLPVLRLYGWAPPCISLGRFQSAEEVLDTEKCTAAGVGVVRRMTGGGAIFHAEELTYGIVCPPESLPAGLSVRESFRALTSFLLVFYEALGLSARYAIDVVHPGTPLGVRTDFCFAGKERYDILVEERKVGGNAQRRQKGVIFQHGSIPVVNHAARGASFMRCPPEGVGEGTAALADLGVASSVDRLKTLLVSSFEAAMGVTLAAVDLSDAELEAAENLRSRNHEDSP